MLKDIERKINRANASADKAHRDEKDPWMSGYRSCLLGIAFGRNPYSNRKKHREHRKLWEAGWDECRADQLENH